MNKKKLTSVAIVFSALFFTLGQRSVYAGVVSINVSVDTSALPATPGYEIVFFLTDGSSTGLTGDANNTAALSSFAFGGGSAGAVDASMTTVGASGSLSGASLTDSEFLNEFAAFFTAGSQISFILNLTTNVDPGPTPDQFGFAILDPSGIPIFTDPITGSNNLLEINLDSANPQLTINSNLVTVTPVGAAPEPTTGVLAAIGSTIIAAILFFGSANKRTTAFRSL
jgi:hypothetical protein